jgi:hypothetical protein
MPGHLVGSLVELAVRQTHFVTDYRHGIRGLLRLRLEQVMKTAAAEKVHRSDSITCN